MASSPPLAHAAHLERATRHNRIAEALADAGDEWAAVPMFYSAYHLLKAAMLSDPIWTDVSRLHAAHADLIADDRFVTRHHGRRRTSAGREWGINELVLLLYPLVVSEYEQLHQASITVRYGAGLPAGALMPLQAAGAAIARAHEAGRLVA